MLSGHLCLPTYVRSGCYLARCLVAIWPGMFGCYLARCLDSIWPGIFGCYLTSCAYYLCLVWLLSGQVILVVIWPGMPGCYLARYVWLLSSHLCRPTYVRSCCYLARCLVIWPGMFGCYLARYVWLSGQVCLDAIWPPVPTCIC